MALSEWIQVNPTEFDAQYYVEDIWFRNNGKDNFKFIVKHKNSNQWNIVYSLDDNDTKFDDIIAGPYETLEMAKVAYTIMLSAGGEA